MSGNSRAFAPTLAQTQQLYGPSSVWEAGLGDGRALVLYRATDDWRLDLVTDQVAGRVTLGSLQLRSPEELDALLAALLSIAARMPKGAA